MHKKELFNNIDYAMIELKKISKKFNRQAVIKNLSFKLKRGEVLGFLGPNGAGKTTTLKMITGLVGADRGTIEIAGLDSRDLKSRQHLGYMPEDPYFYEYLNGREFLIFIAELQKLEKTKRRKEADRLLQLVGLGKEMRKPIRDYSKGMRQRLGIAQALVGNPEILLLDEPLDGLDPIGRQEVKEILLKEKKKGKTILISSHILADIEELADRIAIVNHGQIIAIDPIKKFINKKQSLEKTFVEIINRDDKK